MSLTSKNLLLKTELVNVGLLSNIKGTTHLVRRSAAQALTKTLCIGRIGFFPEILFIS